MKTILLSFFFLITSSLYAQYVKQEDLVFKDRVAYYKKDVYTGKSYLKIEGKPTYLFNYKDGYLHDTIRKGQETFIYNKGIVKEYNYKQKDGIILKTINNSNLQKQIYDIQLGIKFENQVNDTIYIEENYPKSRVDSTNIKPALILYCENGIREFVALPNTKILYTTLYSTQLGCGYLDYRGSGEKVPNHIIIVVHNGNPAWYITSVKYKLPNNEIINVDSKQTIYFRYK